MRKDAREQERRDRDEKWRKDQEKKDQDRLFYQEEERKRHEKELKKFEVNPYTDEMMLCDELIAFCKRYMPKSEADEAVEEVVKQIEAKEDTTDRGKHLKDAI